MLEYIVQRVAHAALDRASLQTVVLVLFALFARIAAIVPVVLLVGFFMR